MLVLKPRLFTITIANELQLACKDLKQVLIDRSPLKVIESELRAFHDYFKIQVECKIEQWFLNVFYWKLRKDFVNAISAHLNEKCASDQALVSWSSVMYEYKQCETHFGRFFYEKLIENEDGFQQLLNEIRAPEGSSAKLARLELKHDSQVTCNLNFKKTKNGSVREYVLILATGSQTM
jgi:hypothetical protein